ncbi:hypothetical protein [Mucilaginibacter sp.]|uniref:hypothetical protein n=1 Tax=Mucilaginibacter sp. TaxID=1882438 RepID=UPI00326514FE
MRKTNTNISLDPEGAKSQKEKISNNELKAFGIDDNKILENFSRVANGLLKHGVMDKTQILANLEALIDNPMPYALKKGGKFKNLAESVIQLRKDGHFLKQQRSIFKLKEEIANFPVWGIEHIEVGALAQMKTAIQLPIAVAGRADARCTPGLRPAHWRRAGHHGQYHYPLRGGCGYCLPDVPQHLRPARQHDRS